MSAAGSDQIPVIRTLQIDDTSIGSVAKSVSLFRGDVNLSLRLLALPGRNGFSVDLSVLYTSNVQTQVNRWALEAPTSVLGLQWQLPLEYIALTDLDVAPDVLVNPTYSLYADGTQYPLNRTDDDWLRAQLDGSYAAVLQGLVGQTVTADVVAALAAQGLAISASTEVHSIPGGVALHDPVLRFTVDALTEDGVVMIYDGGEGFQTLDYQFWQIRYYPTFEVWTIVRESGITTSYGGRDDANAIQWGVKWGGASGAWAGASSNTTGQHRYARAWNRRAVRTVWGDEVTFRYNEPALCGPTEQKVGSEDGLAYTKASYLTGITDVFGRTVRLHYREKTYTDDIREYVDPHQPWSGTFPTFAANPYQDRYETRYLDKLVVENREGALLHTIRLTYHPLKNVSGIDPSTPEYAFGYKRYLRAIVVENPDGEHLPPVEFDYHWDTSDPDAALGALATVVYPNGARVNYAYTRMSLAICDRQQLVQPPPSASWSGTPSPQVFYGDDYVVALWTGTNTSGQSQISATAYTWTGRWVAWSPDALTIAGASNATVTVADNFFVLACEVDGTTNVYGLHQDPRRSGAWIAPSAPITFTGISLADTPIAAGSEFFVVNSQQTQTLAPFTWQWQTQSWRAEAVATIGASGATNWVATAYAACLVLSIDDNQNGTAYIFHVDPLGNWCTGNSQPAGTIAPAEGELLWGTGGAMAAVSFVTSDSGSWYSYDVLVLQWTSEFQLLPIAPATTFSTNYASDFLAMASPVIIDDSLIGSGPNLMRFDGASWSTSQILSLPVTSGGATFNFGYGPDFAVMSSVTSTAGVSASLAAFDPTLAPGSSQAWQSQGLSPPPSATSNAYFVTAGQDYFTLDRYVYARYQQPSLDWLPGSSAPTYATNGMPDGVDTNGAILEPDSFVAYQQASGSTMTASVLLFVNGTVAADQALGEQYDTTASPSGPSTIVTYPTTVTGGFAQAPQFTLWRVAADAIAGNVTCNPVKRATVDDGYQQYHVVFDYDATKATCDPTGFVIKHHRATTFLGTADPKTAQNGHTETLFYNTAVTDPPNAPDALEGLMLEQRHIAQDGTVVAMTRNTWEAFTQREAADGTGVVPVWGSFVRNTAVVDMLDGISRTTRLVYRPEGAAAPVSGQVVHREIRAYGSTGVEESWLTDFHFAYEVYAAFGQQNRLTTTVLQQLSLIEDGAKRVPINVRAQVHQAWQAQTSVTVWDLAADYTWEGHAPIEFDAWGGQRPPENWLLQRMVTARDVYGHELEARDASGVIRSTVYDAYGENVVASFTNASVSGQEAAYFGAEAYENPGSWQVPSGVTVVTGNAHTGVASLSLPAGVTGLGISLTPSTPRTYVFSCWAQTPAGYTGGAAWTYAVSAAGVVIAGGSVDIPATDGVWQYVSLAIPLAGPGPVTITLAASNNSSAAVLLDDLRIAPLDSLPGCATYDPVYLQPLERMGVGADTQRLLRDRFQRTIGHIGPAENVTKLALFYQSRQRHPQFVASDPTNHLDLAPAGGGTLERFADAAWSTRWTASAGWTVDNGCITSPGGGTATLTATGALAGYTSLFVQVQPEAVTSPLGLSLGTTLQVAWQDDAWQLSTYESGWTVAATTSGPAPTAGQTQEWVLVVNAGVALFYVQGAQLFSLAVTGDALGALTLFAGDAVAFDTPVLFSAPQASARFANATSNAIQSQSLDGVGCLVQQHVYDALGRAFLTTKAGPGVTGGGASVPLLQYRPTFYTGYDPTTGTITGDLADYFGATGPSDDAGIPFQQTVFEAAPTSRPVQLGAPGPQLSIGGGHAASIAYSTNTETLGLPAGKYHLQTSTDPDGLVQQLITDATGHVLARTTIGGNTSLVSSLRWQYSAAGVTITALPPNAYASGTADDNWGTARAYDPLGRLRAVQTPDSGTSYMFYDALGRNRIIVTAAGAAADQPYALYHKYDRMGRMIERGTIALAPDAPLAEYARDPAWPAECPTWCQRWHYDGDGSDPRAIGRMLRVETAAVTDSPAVIEDYAYDALGRIVEHGITVADPDVGARVPVRYRHDALGNVLTIELPAELARSGRLTRYTYDPLGRITAIGDADAATTFASYEYAPFGLLATETLHPTGTAPLARTYSYDSPGWLVGTTSTAYSESLAYTPEEVQAVSPGTTAGAYGGTIGRIAHSYTSFTGATYVNQYDAFHRLQSSTNTAGSTGGIGGVTYDGNGNMQTATDQALTYYAETNQVQNTDGGTTNAYAYDPDGQVVSAPGLVVTRDLMTSLARTITGDRVTRLTYGRHNRRVLKTVSSSDSVEKRLYVHGVGGLPQLELRFHNGRQEVVTYHHGPRGPVCVENQGTRRWLVADHQQSTRVVIDAAGAVIAAFDYEPFGGFLQTSGDTSAVDYLYTAQELDRETGLYNYKARLYDAGLRRFFETDTAGEFFSPYLYVGNDPHLYSDPTGHHSSHLGARIGSGIGALASLVVGIVADAFGFEVFGGALIGGGINTISYAATAKDWSMLGSVEAYGEGAMAGLVMGGVGWASSWAMEAADLSAGARTALSVLVKGPLANVAGNEAGTALSLAWNHNRKENREAAIFGAASGAIGGFAAEAAVAVSKLVPGLESQSPALDDLKGPNRPSITSVAKAAGKSVARFAIGGVMGAVAQVFTMEIFRFKHFDGMLTAGSFGSGAVAAAPEKTVGQTVGDTAERNLLRWTYREIRDYFFPPFSGRFDPAVVAPTLTRQGV